MSASFTVLVFTSVHEAENWLARMRREFVVTRTDINLIPGEFGGGYATAAWFKVEGGHIVPAPRDQSMKPRKV